MSKKTKSKKNPRSKKKIKSKTGSILKNACLVCGSPANENFCKIICPNCGAMQDCTDP